MAAPHRSLHHEKASADSTAKAIAEFLFSLREQFVRLSGIMQFGLFIFRASSPMPATL